ncbi:hypothetical protein ASPWEDRAFT_169778 [Aspergillus wentii DTO 134E9]|uniref:Glutathione synthetase n=1 Tax=Aspergillus wentii DTO 134E9 TaxID=1073089 RepID=A0A1L9RYK1_ASPWE|nr:uncharacterized protein ASPWEDRAFT_169778 [Aspergillus wentii DTO 134E9]KAI9931379.1 hypothetical protein MW887_009954 [Aspergillus wentii]OJJ39954.1 hypothetical protein ASPWEDRAFT_169778 [Aspergillus wentii DTO 134E9]
MSDSTEQPEYPPELSEEQGLFLTSQILDWQINHGSLLKRVQTQTDHSVLSHPIGVTVFPTLFPRAQFHRALELQSIYNELYCAVAQDEQWIFEAIQDLLPIDPLAAVLWNVHQQVQKAGYSQPVSAGIFRSDYMLHADRPSDLLRNPEVSLKQVEFNTFSCAGGSHADKVVKMHRYLARTGAYEDSVQLSALPQNDNIEQLADCLAAAHTAYGGKSDTAVLFIVQPNNFNIADERPIEYALWNREQPVPAYRLDFGDVLECTSLAGTGELLFHPPWLSKTVEISVVYMRAGYEAHEYDETGIAARVRLEASLAIKCPSLLAHICTFKKIQHALTGAGVLERFISEEKAAFIRSTFVKMYSLNESDARRLATDPILSKDYILKPSLEGGGHNVFGDAIPDFLASIPESSWGAYILMERIPSPLVMNVLLSSLGIDSGEVISELGIFGTCLWKQGEMLQNSVAGWSFKTKHEDVDEMNVVKGYGCFDTPLLI